MLEPRQMRGFTQTGPVCWNDVMTLGKIFGILMFSSLVAIGATLAGDISKNLANSKTLANSKQVANVEGDKVLPKEASASVVTTSGQKRRSSRGAASACITKPSCIT